MSKKTDKKEKLKIREKAFLSLPPSVRNQLSEEEQEIFLKEEIWPEELFEKLSEFIFPFEEEKLP